MKKISFLFPLYVAIGIFALELNAQDFNEEMKKRLRESLITPEQKPLQLPSQILLQILPQEEPEVLKVSPFTRLPTKFDRIQVLYPPEEYTIHWSVTTPNGTPINQRPAGSVRYEFVGKSMQIISTGGELVVPSGHDFDPVRAGIRKRQKRTDRIMKAYMQQD